MVIPLGNLDRLLGADSDLRPLYPPTSATQKRDINSDTVCHWPHLKHYIYADDSKHSIFFNSIAEDAVIAFFAPTPMDVR